MDGRNATTVLHELFLLYLNDARIYINEACEGKEPWYLILFSVIASFCFIWFWNFIFQEENVYKRFKKNFFKLVKCIPYIKKKIEEEVDKTKKMIEEEVTKGNQNIPFLKFLPKKGLSTEDIVKQAKDYLDLGKIDWKGGRVSGTVYNYTTELTNITSKIYGMCAYTNPLHSDVFPGIRKMEAEVVRMTCNLFHGGEDSCGVMTSGGTESIIMVCKAYRDKALDAGIKYPEIVAPVTAHAAFDKAAYLMRMHIKHIPVDPDTKKVNMKAMKAAISRNTCMLVGSAPQYPHGVIDPIDKISELGVRSKVPVHVDACLGGFLIVFMEKAGFPLPVFDFRLPGVTSISADTHKYGSAPKGSSVVMYKDESFRHYQYFVQPDWPGGIYASPSIPGSRAGGIIAACWAAMTYIGEEGYTENTRKIISVTKAIEKGTRDIKGIKIIGKPEVSVIAFGSDDFDIYRLSDMLSKRGWNLNPLQFPSCIHLCVTVMHTQEGVAESFIQDIKECTAEIMEDPKAKTVGKAAIYGLSQTIPDRSMVSEIACLYIDACYDTNLSNVSNNFT